MPKDFVFSDDDLKRLKERVEQFLVKKRYEVTFNIEEIQALLARLEAAETFCDSVKGTAGWLIPDYDAWKAWRQEAGR